MDHFVGVVQGYPHLGSWFHREGFTRIAKLAVQGADYDVVIDFLVCSVGYQATKEIESKDEGWFIHGKAGSCRLQSANARLESLFLAGSF